MLKRNALTLAAVSAIAVLFLLWRPRSGERAAPRLVPSPAVSASSIPTSPVALPPNPKTETQNPEPAGVFPPAAAEVSTLADALNSPSTDIHRDLRLVAEILATFRSNFPQSGNPAGNNAEITAALTGKNPVHFAFIPSAHPAIDAAGELCDRWGTPFFFHAENATRMEIRSAGPDRKLYTEDDVVFSP